MSIFPRLTSKVSVAFGAIIVAFSMYTGPSAFAATGEQSGDPAYEAFDSGKFLLAIKEAKKAAARGEPQAYTLLGRIYKNGHGVAQNFSEAVRWYQLGAGKGDVHSQFSLGIMLVKGQGITKNEQLAADLFEQAAAKGHVEAQYNLALLYLDGRGRRANSSLGLRYMELAAKAGNIRAQYDLGTLYSPKGIINKPNLALSWTKKAADNGLVEAQLEYAVMLIKGIHLTKADREHMVKTPGSRAPIDRQAANYLYKAAVQGNAIAQNRLARMYLYGFGVNRNLIEAAKWHLVARDKGIADNKLDVALSKLSKEDLATVKREVIRMQDHELLR